MKPAAKIALATKASGSAGTASGTAGKPTG